VTPLKSSLRAKGVIVATIIQYYLERHPMIQWMNLCDYYSMVCMTQRGIAAIKAGKYVTLEQLRQELDL